MSYSEIEIEKLLADAGCTYIVSDGGQGSRSVAVFTISEEGATAFICMIQESSGIVLENKDSSVAVVLTPVPKDKEVLVNALRLVGATMDDGGCG